MSRTSRTKGARIERQLVAQHHDAGIPCEKISRSGYTGPDLRVANEFSAEVKARKSGEGFATLERWLGDADMLVIRAGDREPMAVLPWRTFRRIAQVPEL